MTVRATRTERVPEPPRYRLPWFTEVLLAMVAVALVQGLLVKPFGVPSQSMEQTLRIGDRIIVNRLDTTMNRGDVVVFGHGDEWEQTRRPPDPSFLVRMLRIFGDISGIGPSNTAYTVKRVVGLPGERVACCTADGRVTVGTAALAEPYIFEDLPFTPGELDCSSSERSMRCFPEIQVPTGMLLVLGDHRSESADSVFACRGARVGPECARLVPIDRIVGSVWTRFWPLGEIGGIDCASGTRSCGSGRGGNVSDAL
ncbi:MAG: signal peptidase I [Dermatophilaceae bacterium]